VSTLVAPFLSHTKFFMADMCLFDICGLWCVVHWQQQQCLMGGCRDRWGFLWGPLGPHLGNGLFFVDDIPFRCELDIVKSHTIQFFLAHDVPNRMHFSIDFPHGSFSQVGYGASGHALLGSQGSSDSEVLRRSQKTWICLAFGRHI
jgi:hypothetical protein